MHEFTEAAGVAGKVALVTGAASGIGRAAALLLARHGAVVACADIAAVGAEDTASVIVKDGGHALPLCFDVTSEPDWAAAIQRVLTLHAGLDILVNCAGISFAAPVTEVALEDWRRVMAVNLDGIFLGTKHAVIAMRGRQSQGGSIINVSSASGLKASAGASAYSTSKAAVCMFTKVVAKECLQRGDQIRINTVCPGGVKTPLWKTMPFFQELVATHGSEEAAFRSMELSGPLATPEEIASAILYLASDQARFITGTDLVIDGGYIL